MSKDPGQFCWLTGQFEALLERLREVPGLKKRRRLLRQMRILIDEIDGQILSESKRGVQGVTDLRARPKNPSSGPETPSSLNVVARWK